MLFKDYKKLQCIIFISAALSPPFNGRVFAQSAMHGVSKKSSTTASKQPAASKEPSFPAQSATSKQAAATSPTGLINQPFAKMKVLETGFITVPDNIQTSVYWYWMSDNISKEGVIKDLEAMKKVGINRAFIGNVLIDEVPRGKVKIFSEEWWEIMHTALKTATRLNIEIGIFNSPGWSQSGGPWVKPEQSMRYLTSSQITVKGPLHYTDKLKSPAKDFQDVRVIAYPVAEDFGTDIFKLKPKLSASPGIEDLASIGDDNDQTGIKLKPGQQYTIDISAEELYTARSVTITPLQSAMVLEGDIQIKQNGAYATIKHFIVDRSNDQLNVGFKPYGPAAISIPETSAKEFRIVFTKVSQRPGIASLKISSSPIVEDYIEKTLAKMWQTPFPLWTAYQWQAQPVSTDQKYIIDPGKVTDISSYMNADGTLSWNVPAGNWIIERTGMIPTGVRNSPASPEGTGLEADKMSKKHISAHFDAFLGQIIKRIPAEDRKTWKVTVEDSYETGGQNWTDGLIEKFGASYGYDPTPYLPVLQGKVVGSTDMSDRFLWDLRRFVADKVAYEYVAGLREVSHQNGLTTWLENYGHWGFPGEFLQYGGQSDEIGGEFWSVGDLGNIENRAASSSAHIYGKTKVSAESFTSGDPAFSRYPAQMKQRADRFFTEGINNTLLHVFIEQPDERLPGVNAPFGNEFNRHNTWFYDMDIFLRYLKRCNLMLQQGRYVADVAYFIGEDAPKMTGVQDPQMPKGYSFDYINAEVIKSRLTVKNGRLTLPDGLSYGVLVLPKMESIRPEVLLKIKELVNQGAVVLGAKPLRSPSLQNFGKADKEVQELASQLWGNTNAKVNRVGKGMVINGMDLQEVLDLIKVKPDLKADSILFIHRTLPDGDIYFISNQKNSPVKLDATFRLGGKVPELWDPVAGSIRNLPAYTQNSNTTSVPLELDATGSAFVIFRKDVVKTTAGQVKVNYPEAVQTMTVTSPWTVTFDKSMRGPAQPLVLKTLTDWTQSTNDSVKYYSGAAVYRTTVNLVLPAKGMQVMLDLGRVAAIAKVKVNGIDAGGVWTAPYEVNITKLLKSGKNELEIKVINTWVNRLIGDSKLPDNKKGTWLSVNPYKSDSKLQPSGLLEPLKLKMIKY
ncbi:MAG: glycosyl hydrolase [Pedobacter sp.]|uniref:glycosyl hydrolase n=1 Tax=Pedobacter sp. TaxID=1411316 RepID=UPI0033987723